MEAWWLSWGPCLGAESGDDLASLPGIVPSSKEWRQRKVAVMHAVLPVPTATQHPA